jgi:ferritin
MENLLSSEIIELIEFRIAEEEKSARLYNQMSLWLENKGYSNVAKVYKEYSNEEREHASWGCNYLLAYGVAPRLKTLESPYVEYESCMDILEATLEHELEIERQCNEMTLKALSYKNMGLYQLGLKYCEEQIDEIQKAIDLIDQAKLTTDMLVFDHYVEKYLV